RAEFATDNTSHYLQQITNQEINKLIVYQVNHHETIISIIHSFIYMSLYLFIYLCRNILSFLLIIYEIITNKNRYNVSMHQSELEFVNLSNGHRILQTAENLNNNVQNNHQLDQTIFDNEQRTRTDTLLSHHEPIEMQENVSVLIEDARATIEDATCLISIFNQKQTNPTDLNIESDEIRID
ncbi:unnamed protein product, partial [Rotaria sp. Silwood1]